jgi:peptidoglycan hydrolase-like protein with peptidoglycan-binding domain
MMAASLPGFLTKANKMQEKPFDRERNNSSFWLMLFCAFAILFLPTSGGAKSSLMTKNIPYGSSKLVFFGQDFGLANKKVTSAQTDDYLQNCDVQFWTGDGKLMNFQTCYLNEDRYFIEASVEERLSRMYAWLKSATWSVDKEGQLGLPHGDYRYRAFARGANNCFGFKLLFGNAQRGRADHRLTGFYCDGRAVPDETTIQAILKAIGYKHDRFGFDAVKPKRAGSVARAMSSYSKQKEAPLNPETSRRNSAAGATSKSPVDIAACFNDPSSCLEKAPDVSVSREAEAEERRLAFQRRTQEKAASEKHVREQTLVEERSVEGARKRLIQGQAALSKIGLYQGKIDGIPGPRTSAAVARWLKQNGQSEGAELTDETVALMQQQADAKQSKALVALRKAHKHSIAVIIGNRDYSGRTPDVTYAGNDADAVRNFVIGDLGYRPGNVIDLRDASLTQLNATFGTAGNHRGRLFDYVREGKSDVIVFYSGHGVPGLRDRKGYLLPVDADPNRAELNGYPLEVLLANLAKVPARSMAVYIDACFSGESQKGLLVRATSGITVQAKVPKSSKRMVVVTAAQGDQFASWDEDARHGLFTKHLLEALRGRADGDGYGNGDGKVTLSELRAYLDEEMTYQARRRWSRDQNASIQGADSAVLATLR